MENDLLARKLAGRLLTEFVKKGIATVRLDGSVDISVAVKTCKLIRLEPTFRPGMEIDTWLLGEGLVLRLR